MTGLLVVGSILVLTAVLILLGAPGLFRPLVTYRIYFDNAAGVKLGAPVLLAGRKIGTVDKLMSPVSKEEDQRAQEVAAALKPPDPNATPPPPNGKPKYEVRIEVQVDKDAMVYRDAKARLTAFGLLGEMVIDFGQGNDASGRAKNGEIFAGERVPDFGEAVSKMLQIIDPVAIEAANTMRELQATSQNLSRLTDESSSLNLALGEFRVFGQHLVQLTGPESSLSLAIKNIEDVSRQLTENNNIQTTIGNIRDASEKLNSTMNTLGPELKTSASNIKDFTETLRKEPWRAIWPSTKKYAEEPPRSSATGGDTITVRKSTKSASPTPKRRRSVIVP